MTYASLTKKIKSLPEECLEEIDNSPAYLYKLGK